jgi:hypothetical protein
MPFIVYLRDGRIAYVETGTQEAKWIYCKHAIIQSGKRDPTYRYFGYACFPYTSVVVYAPISDEEFKRVKELAKGAVSEAVSKPETAKPEEAEKPEVHELMLLETCATCQNFSKFSPPKQGGYCNFLRMTLLHDTEKCMYYKKR